MECAYYSRWTAHGMCLLLWVDGTWNVPTTLGGRHMECAYCFDLGRLCPLRRAADRQPFPDSAICNKTLLAASIVKSMSSGRWVREKNNASN